MTDIYIFSNIFLPVTHTYTHAHRPLPGRPRLAEAQEEAGGGEADTGG